MGWSVTGAGDVNGDGYADVIVGALDFDAGQTTEGAAFVFLGNAGRHGRPVLARQGNAGGPFAPQEPWGRSSSATSSDVRLQGSHPAGRGRVALELEWCAPGVAFGHPSCGSTQSAFVAVSPPTSSATLTAQASGLAPETLYRWRARVLHADTTGPTSLASHGPWRRVQGQAVEADLRTAVDPVVCGDGAIDPPEVCDDGNPNPGDGCSATCAIEPGWECSGEPSVCAALPVCDNGLDDDGEGQVDFRWGFGGDPGCTSAADPSERQAGGSNPCDDGADNDGDSLADFPADPGCINAVSLRENPACNDGMDNDGDGAADLADADCGGIASRPSETAVQPGSYCGFLGIEAVPALLAATGLRRRRLRRDSA